MPANATDPIVVVGMACRLPGCDSVAMFEQLLFDSQSAIAAMPEERLDRELYLNTKRNQPGMTYTDIGGFVPDRVPCPDARPDGHTPETAFDPAHLQFCDVARQAWNSAGLAVGDSAWQNCGVFVGHSGGTANGGPLGLATQIEEALSFLQDVPEFAAVPLDIQQRLIQNVTQILRQSRPRRALQDGPRYNAYQAAALAANALQLHGPRLVVDGACASSLIGLDHAIMAIRAGRIDSAVVGGATYNGADNLILFSQSQACSDTGSCPFDDSASGLISSEGYVAVVVTTLSKAMRHGLHIEAVITGVGVSSDGKGRSLWAPRSEGQQLALQRAYADRTPLDIDYLEAHATSTQLGDATELQSVNTVAADRLSALPVRIGSVKSNIGHTLESAGLIGLVKVILAMRRRQLPPSINVKSLNQTFDWSDGRIHVVTRTEPWEPCGAKRRAAVSAFGIGGLNAHLVVEEFIQPTHPAASQNDVSTEESGLEPIAIIGRGVVLPGALNVAAFEQLLKSGESAIVDAPQDRWRNGIGIEPADATSAYVVPTSRGGFITDFVFDAQTYRIPPKQVRQANPVQMMLLDAVSQAVNECDGGSWSFDRQRTAVVIGTIFGTEFGNQLQIGLRLPEICREIEQQLRAEGYAVDAEHVAREFRKIVLQNRPALLDETGSFTASTLASRVAKTFDLMGGAGAIDADDSSGLAALSVAVDKLRRGQCDTVVCGAAHRAMDLSAFEELKMNGRLVHSGLSQDVPDDCSRVLPGEGVVTLLLCRKSDAERRNLKILGLIGETTTGVQRATAEQPVFDATDAGLVRQIGYLSGSQPLVRLISETLNWQSASTAEDRQVRLTSRASDGFTVHIDVAAEGHETSSNATPLPVQNTSPDTLTLTKPEAMINQTPRVNLTRQASATTSRVLKIGAKTEQEFYSAVESAISSGAPPEYRAAFSPDDQFRLAILRDSSKPMVECLNVVRSAWISGVRRRVFETERAVLWQCQTDVPRIAWLFPGQGSQYAARPSVLDFDSAAAARLAQLDAELVAMGLAPLTPQIEDRDSRLGKDVWQTQLWVLGIGLGLTASLHAKGYRPDVVLGHSFGEYVAAVAAGVMSPAQALRIIRHRSDAVIMNTRERGVLLSVRGSLNEVDAVLRESGLPLTITHNNSPVQTVVAGPETAIQEFRKSLNSAKLASIVVAVPAPFHTSMLAAAEVAMNHATSSEQLRPPACGFLSATSGQFLAEPETIRHSLVTQLTQPVLYQPSVRRLLDTGSRVLLEVGPNDVLTRLNREIVGNEALCFSLDVPSQTWEQRTAMLSAVMDCVFETNQASLATAAYANVAPEVAPQAKEDFADPPAAAKSDDVEIVDLTRRSRGQRTSASADATVHVANGKSTPAAVPGPLAEIQPALQNGSASKAHVQVSEEPQTDQSELVRRFLLDLVVELTGYSRDILDFDADLEADLGLDSIKTAQIVGELAEWAELKVEPTDLRFKEIRTLADVAALAGDAHVPKTQGTAKASEQSAPIPQVVAAAATNGHASSYETALTTSTPCRADADAVADLLIEFVVDLTGYDRDIVDLDADLEAELGLDSIKIAQIVGELQEQFELRAIRADQLSLGDFRTLRSIQSFLLKSMADQYPDQQPATHSSPPVTSAPVASTAASPCFEPVNSVVASAVTQVANEPQIIGCEPCDHMPSDWAQLFQARSEAADPAEAWQSGFERGIQHRAEARAALRLLVDTSQPTSLQNGLSAADPQWNSLAEQEMRGFSSGAGVAFASVRYAAATVPNGRSVFTTASPTISAPIPCPQKTHRFALRMLPAPRRERMPSVPVLHGPVLLIGQNALVDALAKRVRASGQAAFTLTDIDSIEQAEARLAEIWQQGPTPHLFILTACDNDALVDLDAAAWNRRRVRALQIPFRVCQLWMQNIIDAGLMEDASVVTVSRLGGDLGFSGQQVESPESLAGLVKAMLIESWMREFRTTPMKVVDLVPNTPVELAVDGILHELAVPSYDMEVSVSGTDRRSVQAVPAELQPASAHHHSNGNGNGKLRGRRITPGGTWILSGGGRGITAMTGMALAERYDLHLHLLGTAPAPNISSTMRQAAANRSQLRRQVMATAGVDENPVELWRNTEKAIEIDATLHECHRRGIVATYHSCDVSDAASVARVLAEIRRTDGPIRGVLHGAGAGQDSRFDRKRPDKVEKCLRAKIDGCLALMDETRSDPLEWFVAYGSISGRFGANGHTDYSLANDMMAKLVDRYRSERPEVSSLTFHWHAWGDVGMATKPEARLALEMIDMEFMAAEEGVAHFLREFEMGGDEPEVLITDHSYFRKFFPAERINDDPFHETVDGPPLLGQQQPATDGFTLTLDPIKDRFLSQHRVADRPTLPFVVALELMAEAARLQSGNSSVIECQDVVAAQAIKFATDDAMAVSIVAERDGQDWLHCHVKADVRRRDGRIVEQDRTYFSGRFRTANSIAKDVLPLPCPTDATWDLIQYLDRDAPIYHGPELQGLRKIAVDGTGGWGRIAASAPVQLFGADRTRGWTVPCAAMDACLYAVAVVGWKKYSRASLPVKFGSIRFGRQPDPGEPCLVRVDIERQIERGLCCNFCLQGLNGDVLLTATDFEIAWLR